MLPPTVLVLLDRQRPYSIRTRIKTGEGRLYAVMEQQVRDHIPLEQGLRQPKLMWHPFDAGQRPYSIRTRIKTPSRQQSESYSDRQRPYSIRTRIKTAGVVMHEIGHASQRPYSIRTRIKTFSYFLLNID